MNTRSLLSYRVVGPLLVLGLFAGCDRSQSNASSSTASATVNVQENYAVDPPPLAQSEVTVASPGPDYVWVAGYWGWRPGPEPHVWVKGHWERPPHAHATWEKPRWDRHDKGYVFVRGTWH